MIWSVSIIWLDLCELGVSPKLVALTSEWITLSITADRPANVR